MLAPPTCLVWTLPVVLFWSIAEKYWYFSQKFKTKFSQSSPYRLTRIVYFVISRENDFDVPHPLYFWNYKRGYLIAFYVSYIHSRIIDGVPMERACKDDPNHIKFSK